MDWMLPARCADDSAKVGDTSTLTPASMMMPLMPSVPAANAQCTPPQFSGSMMANLLTLAIAVVPVRKSAATKSGPFWPAPEEGRSRTTTSAPSPVITKVLLAAMGWHLRLAAVLTRYADQSVVGARATSAVVVSMLLPVMKANLFCPRLKTTALSARDTAAVPQVDAASLLRVPHAPETSLSVRVANSILFSVT